MEDFVGGIRAVSLGPIYYKTFGNMKLKALRLN